MKKHGLMLGAFVLTVALLVGCGPKEAPPETQATTAETTTVATTAAPTTTAPGEIPSDISNAVDATTTTETAPVKLNQWAKTPRYSPVTQTYENVYVRITKVVPASKDQAFVDKAIETHNSVSSDYAKIDKATLKVPSDAEICVMEYEVAVPKEFSRKDYGIIAPTLSFSARSIGGGGIPTKDGTATYIGMGSIKKMDTEKNPKYDVGKTYTFRTMYVMVQGYENYVFDTTTYPSGYNRDSGNSSEKLLHVYFGIK